MGLWQIALRNLGRNRARSLLSLFAIAVGVFVVLITKGFIDGALEQMYDGTIRLGSGHIRVVEEEYPLKEQLLSLTNTVDDDLVEKLQAIDGIEGISPRLRFGGLISKEEKTHRVIITGLIPSMEDTISGMSRYLSGRWMEPHTREAVLGTRLLHKLGLEIGDRFTLVFNTAFGSMRGYTFTIVGEINSGYLALDDQRVFLDLGLAQSMLEMEGEVTEILMLAHREKDVPWLLPQVEEVIGPTATAIPWYSHSEMIEYMLRAEGAYNIIYVLILGLAGFVVINTMSMVINERMREIGMLGALGLSPRQVMGLFLYEGGILGLGGSLVGAFFGSILLGVLSIRGLDLYDPADLDAQYYLTPQIFPRLDPWVLVFAIVLGILITTIAVWIPARTAAKLEPTEALRGGK
ncbi:MAG: ABC transporter permease [Limnochordia bacterium]|jgi:putative ABC transport system permease protein